MLSDFMTWRSAQEGTTEAAWVKLTNCYQPSSTEAVAVGLAYVGSFCRYYGSLVVSRLTTYDLGFHIVLTHELGHVLNSFHDSVPTPDPACPAGDFIMSAITPNDALTTVDFSSCSKTNITLFLETDSMVNDCLFRKPFLAQPFSNQEKRKKSKE